METIQHIQNGGGICGTCAQPAQATPENEGYSYCCNDRIEYGDEALTTLKRSTCSHAHTHKEYSPGGDPGYRYFEVHCNDCGEYVDYGQEVR